jgi:hypothetical protein
MGMARSGTARKHYRLHVAKIKKAQRLLKAGTETETLNRALDVVIAEDARNRLTREANDRFLRSGFQISGP